MSWELEIRNNPSNTDTEDHNRIPVIHHLICDGLCYRLLNLKLDYQDIAFRSVSFDAVPVLPLSRASADVWTGCVFIDLEEDL